MSVCHRYSVQMISASSLQILEIVGQQSHATTTTMYHRGVKSSRMEAVEEMTTILRPWRNAEQDVLIPGVQEIASTLNVEQTAQLHVPTRILLDPVLYAVMSVCANVLLVQWSWVTGVWNLMTAQHLVSACSL